MHRAFSFSQILKVAAEAAGLRVAELMGASRARPLVNARQRSIYVARRLCWHLSYPDLGRALGGRDHTTALHADREVARRLTDPKHSVEEGAAIATILRGLGVEELPERPADARIRSRIQRDLTAVRLKAKRLQAEAEQFSEPS